MKIIRIDAFHKGFRIEAFLHANPEGTCWGFQIYTAGTKDSLKQEVFAGHTRLEALIGGKNWIDNKVLKKKKVL